jgi:excisionase family DNA binding protein
MMKAKDKAREPQFYNVATAAELLGVDVKTVRNWIADGKLPGSFKLGTGETSSFAIPSELVSRLQKERDQSAN